MDAGGDLDDGGLAAAVFAGQAVDLPLLDLQAHALKGLDAAERLGDALDLEHVVRHHPLGSRPSRTPGTGGGREPSSGKLLFRLTTPRFRWASP
jgi:hypothetical protein